MDLVELCALGEAAWQRAAHEALGKPWTAEAGVAWAPGGAGHRFLLGAVTLAPVTSMPSLSCVAGTVCDSFGTLDEHELHHAGYGRTLADPWMIRSPEPRSEGALVPGLEIREVETDEELSLFERTAFVAAGGQPPSIPGELHPPGSQRTSGLHLLVAWLRGAPVGTALALVHRHGVVISAVAVVPDARGRGVGRALTEAALGTAPGRYASLAASSQGAALYRSLGFQDVARPRYWRPTP